MNNTSRLRLIIPLIVTIVFLCPKAATAEQRDTGKSGKFQSFSTRNRDLLFNAGNGSYANYNFDRIVDLRGIWKFETGDKDEWAAADFNDKSWAEIYVPSAWEDEGFPGYDGYAWYRKEFELNSDLDGKSVYLYIGYIDDVDEVFVNGHLIGLTGHFPPKTVERDYILRRYLIPRDYLDFYGNNMIAVRVYDSRLAGGIIKGKPGIYINSDEVIPDRDLRGLWKFKRGDRSRWSNPTYNDRSWDEIQVPAVWETQGYQKLDGYAWYRKHISIDATLASERLVLLVGRIDDYDEVYFNGQLIGGSPQMKNPQRRILAKGEWIRIRAYYIPVEYIDLTGDNVIAVRVYDGLEKGGIYDGPVGLFTQSSFKNAQFNIYNQDRKKFWDTVKDILDSLF